MQTKTDAPSLLSVEEVRRLVDETFPALHAGGRTVTIEAVADRIARIRLHVSERNIRPGGTISGPAMFMLADLSIYAALIATLGASAIPAVTSNLNINFLSRPEPAELLCDARLLRIGRRLAYAEASVFADGAPSRLLAHATGSYALPSPERAIPAGVNE
jgi:uncharacterized protein (TIGR00369 family)